MKIINTIMILFAILLSGCCIGDKSDQFTFSVKNECPYPIQCAYLRYGGVKEYRQVDPQDTFSDGGGSRRKCGATFEETKENYFAKTDDKISILYPDGHEELMTVREFVAKAEMQTGSKSREDWTLVLCPGG